MIPLNDLNFLKISHFWHF